MIATVAVLVIFYWVKKRKCEILRGNEFILTSPPGQPVIFQPQDSGLKSNILGNDVVDIQQDQDSYQVKNLQVPPQKISQLL